jgi:hypothetical protein
LFFNAPLHFQALEANSTVQNAVVWNAMTRPIALAVFIAALVLVIVGIDLLFFRDRFWARLFANIGIVLLFVAFYVRYFK